VGRRFSFDPWRSFQTGGVRRFWAPWEFRGRVGVVAHDRKKVEGRRFAAAGRAIHWHVIAPSCDLEMLDAASEKIEHGKIEAEVARLPRPFGPAIM
jgi:hypothetical protein